MNWLAKYKRDLASLESARVNMIPIDLSKPDELDNISRHLSDIVAPFKGKKLNSQALDQIAKRWWEQWKAEEIASLRKEIKLHLRLMPLYKKLSAAKEPELGELGLLLLRERLQLPLFKKLLQDWMNADSFGITDSAKDPKSTSQPV
jgi:hypothetical protein